MGSLQATWHHCKEYVPIDVKRKAARDKNFHHASEMCSVLSSCAMPDLLPQLHWHRQLWSDGRQDPIPEMHLQHRDRPAQVQHLLHGRRLPAEGPPEDLHQDGVWGHLHQHDQPHHLSGEYPPGRCSTCWPSLSTTCASHPLFFCATQEMKRRFSRIKWTDESAC